MVKDLELRKTQLIEQIKQLDNELSLTIIENQMAQLQKQAFQNVIKPIQKTPTISEMIEKQHYKPISKENFFQKTKEIDIEEPLDKLLIMLKQ